MIPKVLIIDGNNLAHMAFYNNVMYNSGKRTELIFTGLKMIRNLLVTHNPDRVTVVWDGGRDKRRMELYPEYKQHREKELTENEIEEKKIFFEQMDELIGCISNLGISQFRVQSREADDVIYNLIKMIDGRLDGVCKFVIVSSDKDFLQLIKHFKSMVFVYNPVKKREWSGSGFEMEFGFDVEYYTFYKSLLGDPSDNLPGIKGIGEKGAKFLIQEVFSKDAFYQDDFDKLTAFQKRMIRLLDEGFDDLVLMKKMIWFMDIDRDEIQNGKIKNVIEGKNKLYENGVSILTNYGFQSLLDKYESFIQPFCNLIEGDKK